MEITNADNVKQVIDMVQEGLNKASENLDLLTISAHNSYHAKARGRLGLLRMPREVGLVEIDIKTLGQFTGMLDRNGKKIFEGDILRYFNSDEYLATVVWAVEAWCIIWQKPNVRGCMGELILVNTQIDGEVIGNIFENPELLSLKQDNA